MTKLSLSQVGKLLRGYEAGTSVKDLAANHGISIQAVYAWVPYVGLRGKVLQRVKTLEHRTAIAEGRLLRQSNLLRIATGVITDLQRSPKRRAILATIVRARHGIARRTANAIVGLGATAGESPAAARADRVLIEAMQRHQKSNPGGFRSMINSLIRDQPGTRGRALSLYTEHVVERNKKALRAKQPKPATKHLATQGAVDQMWSMDFMQDALPDGSRYWLLNVIDDFNREAVVVQVLKRRSAKAVITHLGTLSTQGRLPTCIRTDNGGEFKSKVYQTWTDAHAVRRQFIRPRVPNDNAYIESFNRTLRNQVLSRYTFSGLAEVQRALDDWALRYNYVRPHAALNELSPMQFAEVARRAGSNSAAQPRRTGR